MGCIPDMAKYDDEVNPMRSNAKNSKSPFDEINENYTSI